MPEPPSLLMLNPGKVVFLAPRRSWAGDEDVIGRFARNTYEEKIMKLRARASRCSILCPWPHCNPDCIPDLIPSLFLIPEVFLMPIPILFLIPWPESVIPITRYMLRHSIIEQDKSQLVYGLPSESSEATQSMR